MSRIIEYTNPYFPEKKWFRCKIKNETYSSPHREQVELWRDDKMINSEYYEELDKLRSNTLHHMYKNNHNNWTGD
jgi:hypothetical protein